MNIFLPTITAAGTIGPMPRIRKGMLLLCCMLLMACGGCRAQKHQTEVSAMPTSIPAPTESTIPAGPFKEMLRARILETLDRWPAEDQYAVMFFIYPNLAYEYKGCTNVAEFIMLYQRESDLSAQHNPFFPASDEDEARWSIAFWDDSMREVILQYDTPNPMADALFAWYQELGVEHIGEEDDVESFSRDYHGPNGLPELLEAATEIAADLQREGVLKSKFGKPIPIILADYEFTWYMLEATRRANPNGEADAYLEACERMGVVAPSP